LEKKNKLGQHCYGFVEPEICQTPIFLDARAYTESNKPLRQKICSLAMRDIKIAGRSACDVNNIFGSTANK